MGDFCRMNSQQMSCLHMSSDCISGIHVDFMSFLKRLHVCGSSKVFQGQMIQLEETSTMWNHMCMNLRMLRMPQVLDPILR